MADDPLINGHRYGWSSIDLNIKGKSRAGFTEIEYDTDADPGEARGKGVRVKGTVRGDAKDSGSFSMNLSDARELLADLGPGFMQKKFNIVVSYDEDGEGGVITDKLLGCQIKKVSNAPKRGNEAAQTKFDLHIMRITYSGLDPVVEK